MAIRKDLQCTNPECETNSDPLRPVLVTGYVVNEVELPGVGRSVFVERETGRDDADGYPEKEVVEALCDSCHAKLETVLSAPFLRGMVTLVRPANGDRNCCPDGGGDSPHQVEAQLVDVGTGRVRPVRAVHQVSGGKESFGLHTGDLATAVQGMVNDRAAAGNSGTKPN